MIILITFKVYLVKYYFKVKKQLTKNKKGSRYLKDR